jgi:hypothetical protein
MKRNNVLKCWWCDMELGAISRLIKCNDGKKKWHNVPVHFGQCERNTRIKLGRA